MSGYLLIASRDPFESQEIRSFYRLAESLAHAHEQVTLVLVQNGVLPARAGVDGGWIEELASAGVEILADEFSLRERGITRTRLAERVTPVSIDAVVEQLASGKKALWQ